MMEGAMADRIRARADVWFYGWDKVTERDKTDANALAYADGYLEKNRRIRHDEGAVIAYINHGRWVADCECHAGMMVSPESETAICLECGASYTVTFPPAATRERIEATLLRRPEDKHRNWTPGETVDALEAETKDRMAQEVAELRARANAMAKELRG